MAEPQKKSAGATSTVAQCSATDCTHNEDQDCHAGEIVVQINGRQATCETYEPTGPKARP